MNKKIFLILLLVLICFSITACTTTGEQFEAYEKSTYETMNLIVSNDYGKEISNLKYNKEKGYAGISFDLKKDIIFAQKVEFKDSILGTNAKLTLSIQSLVDEKYVIDIVNLICFVYTNNYYDKEQLTSQLKGCMENKNDKSINLSINIKNGTIQRLGDKIYINIIQQV